jgi:hypothetical protein
VSPVKYKHGLYIPEDDILLDNDMQFILSNLRA